MKRDEEVFLERRHRKPDYELDIYISGVVLGDTGKCHWNVEFDEGIDKQHAADILEKAVEVLRK